MSTGFSHPVLIFVFLIYPVFLFSFARFFFHRKQRTDFLNSVYPQQNEYRDKIHKITGAGFPDQQEQEQAEDCYLHGLYLPCFAFPEEIHKQRQEDSAKQKKLYCIAIPVSFRVIHAVIQEPGMKPALPQRIPLQLLGSEIYAVAPGKYNLAVQMLAQAFASIFFQFLFDICTICFLFSAFSSTEPSSSTR